ncbi:tRNA (guanine-N(7)-)-methyltransferase (tRNA(m7G46)-methyltransferase) [Sorochytrium milnesiophthora]
MAMALVTSLLYSLVGVAGAWVAVAVALQVREARASVVRPPTRPDIKPLTVLMRNWDAARVELLHAAAAASTTSNVDDDDDAEAKKLPAPLPVALNVSDSSPDINKELEAILGFIMRDFVLSWFRSVICNPRDASSQQSADAFPNHVAFQLVVIVANIKRRLEHVDVVHTLVDRLVPLLTTHVHEFRRAEQSLRGANDDRVLTESTELHEMIALRYNNQAGTASASSTYALHPALANTSSTSLSELAYLRQVVDKILPKLYPGPDTRSNLSRTLLREIVACSVLKPVIDALSQPNFWNELIDLLAGRAIRELNMVNKLREALKKQSEVLAEEAAGTVDIDSALSSASLQARPNAQVRSYEDFLRLIKNCKNLLEAKRIRNHIVMEIRKRRLEIANHQPTDVINGVKVAESVRYINKLIVAKRRVEKRITTLGGQSYRSRRMTSMRMTDAPMDDESLTLLHILKTSAGLSSFMEFMDQRARTRVLQFWLMTESFRQHFEQYQLQRQPQTSTPTLPNAPDPPALHRQLTTSTVDSVDWSTDYVDVATLKQDARLIYDTFLSPQAPKRVLVDIEVVSAVESLMEALLVDHGHRTVEYDFSCLFEAQDQVYDDMNKLDFPQFRLSDLYINFVNSPGARQEMEGFLGTMAASADGGAGQWNALGASPWDRPRPKLGRTPLSKLVYQAPLSAKPDAPRERIATASVTDNVIQSAGLGRGSAPAPARDVDTASFTSSLTSMNDLSHGGTLTVTASATANNTLDSASNSTVLVGSSVAAATDKDAANTSAFSRLPSLPSPSSTLAAISSSFWFPGKRLLAETRSSNTSAEALDTLTEVAVIENMDEMELLKSDAVEAVEAELANILEHDGGDQSSTSPQSLTASGSVTSEAAASDLSATDVRPASANTSLSLNPLDLLERFRGRRQSSSVATTPASSPHIPFPASPKPALSPVLSEDSESAPRVRSGSTASTSSRHSLSGHTGPVDPPLLHRASSSSAEDQSMMPPPPPPLSRLRTSSSASLSPLAQIRQELDKLAQQEAIVDTLLANAREQNRNAQLIKILQKSKVALQNEMRGLLWQEIQMQKHQGQEALFVPGRSSVSIISSTTGTSGTKEFALYIIEVSNPAMNSVGAHASWIVARRYSEFFALHQQLKQKYPVVQQYELPKKMPNALMNYRKNFVEIRRERLEKYLQNLCRHPEICDDEEFKRFLCQEPVTEQDVAPAQVPSHRSSIDLPGSRRTSSSFIQTVKNKITEGLDDMFVSSRDALHSGTRASASAAATGIASGSSLFDRITAKLSQQLHSSMSASSSSVASSPAIGSTTDDEDATTDPDLSSSRHPRSQYRTPSSRGSDRDRSKEREDRSAAEPLSDLFIEVFELTDKNNWLRKQAVVILLQQIFGGTIDRKVVEIVDALCSDANTLMYLQTLRAALWPGGELKKAGVPKTDQEKAQISDDARRKLVTLIPEVLGPFVGRGNARKGANRIHSLLQNQILNRHLLYSLLDILVEELFAV